MLPLVVIVFDHNILILELLKILPINVEGELPNVAFCPFHLGNELFPVSKLRDTTDNVDILPQFTLVFYIEVLFGG